MNEKLQNQVSDLLGQLAESLGTTAPYLWEVLINQAGIVAITHTLGTLFVFCIFITEFFLVKHTIKNGFEEGPIAVLSVIFGIMSFAGLIILTADGVIHTLITALFNPEYWALKEILNIF